MTDPQSRGGHTVELCLICDGKMKHTSHGEPDLWVCENYANASCSYEFVDSEDEVKYHNERYAIIRLGQQAPALLRQRDELVKAAKALIDDVTINGVVNLQMVVAKCEQQPGTPSLDTEAAEVPE